MDDKIHLECGKNMFFIELKHTTGALIFYCPSYKKHVRIFSYDNC